MLLTTHTLAHKQAATAPVYHQCVTSASTFIITKLHANSGSHFMPQVFDSEQQQVLKHLDRNSSQQATPNITQHEFQLSCSMEMNYQSTAASSRCAASKQVSTHATRRH
jgi:hypothetical protein